MTESITTRRKISRWKKKTLKKLSLKASNRKDDVRYDDNVAPPVDSASTTTETTTTGCSESVATSNAASNETNVTQLLSDQGNIEIAISDDLAGYDSLLLTETTENDPFTIDVTEMETINEESQTRDDLSQLKESEAESVPNHVDPDSIAVQDNKDAVEITVGSSASTKTETAHASETDIDTDSATNTVNDADADSKIGSQAVENQAMARDSSNRSGVSIERVNSIKSSTRSQHASSNKSGILSSHRSSNSVREMSSESDSSIQRVTSNTSAASLELVTSNKSAASLQRVCSDRSTSSIQRVNSNNSDSSNKSEDLVSITVEDLKSARPATEPTTVGKPLTPEVGGGAETEEKLSLDCDSAPVGDKPAVEAAASGIEDDKVVVPSQNAVDDPDNYRSFAEDDMSQVSCGPILSTVATTSNIEEGNGGRNLDLGAASERSIEKTKFANSEVDSSVQALAIASQEDGRTDLGEKTDGLAHTDSSSKRLECEEQAVSLKASANATKGAPQVVGAERSKRKRFLRSLRFFRHPRSERGLDYEKITLSEDSDNRAWPGEVAVEDRRIIDDVEAFPEDHEIDANPSANTVREPQAENHQLHGGVDQAITKTTESHPHGRSLEAADVHNDGPICFTPGGDPDQSEEEATHSAKGEENKRRGFFRSLRLFRGSKTESLSAIEQTKDEGNHLEGLLAADDPSSEAEVSAENQPVLNSPMAKRLYDSPANSILDSNTNEDERIRMQQTDGVTMTSIDDDADPEDAFSRMECCLSETDADVGADMGPVEVEEEQGTDDESEEYSEGTDMGEAIEIRLYEPDSENNEDEDEESYDDGEGTEGTLGDTIEGDTIEGDTIEGETLSSDTSSTLPDSKLMETAKELARDFPSLVHSVMLVKAMSSGVRANFRSIQRAGRIFGSDTSSDDGSERSELDDGELDTNDSILQVPTAMSDEVSDYPEAGCTVPSCPNMTVF